MPGLPDVVDIELGEKGTCDYKSPSVNKFFNKHKKAGSFGYKSCQAMATAIKENLEKVEDNDAIDCIELSQMGGNDPKKADKAGFFLNINLKNSFIEQQIRNIYLSKEI